MAAPNKARIFAIAGGVAAITATGTWYGAGLKTSRVFKQEKQVVIQSTAADKITHLQNTKDKLIKQRSELQTKIDELAMKSTPDGTTTNDTEG